MAAAATAPCKTKNNAIVNVTNIGVNMTNDRLKKMFENYGTIASYGVLNDDEPSKRFAFVTFDDSDAADEAVIELNGQLIDDNRRLRVRRTRKSENNRDKPRSWSRNRTITPAAGESSNSLATVAASNVPATGTLSNGLATGALSRDPIAGASSNGPATQASSSGPATQASSNDPATLVSSQSLARGASSKGPTAGASLSNPATQVSSHGPVTQASSHGSVAGVSSSSSVPQASSYGPVTGVSSSGPATGASSNNTVPNTVLINTVPAASTIYIRGIAPSANTRTTLRLGCVRKKPVFFYNSDSDD